MKLIIFAFSCFLLCFLSKKRYSAYLWFFVPFVVMGFQSNVSGDYDTYKGHFDNILGENGFYNDVEHGWYYLNKYLGFLNFESFILLVSLFEYYILSKFCKTFVDKKWVAISAIVFFFDISMMYFQMKALRQAFAIGLELLAFLYYYKHRNNLKFTHVIVAMAIAFSASFFHETALVVTPIFLLFCIISYFKLGDYSIKLNDYFLPVIMVGAFYFLYISKIAFIDYIRPLLLGLDLGGKEGYFGEMQITSYHIIIDLYKGFLLFYLSFYLKYSSGFTRYFAIMAIVGVFLDMLLFGMGSLYRVPVYFTIFYLAVIPNVSNTLFKRKKIIQCMIFTIITIAYSFRLFITVSTGGAADALDTYKFIFEPW